MPRTGSIERVDFVRIYKDVWKYLEKTILRKLILQGHKLFRSFRKGEIYFLNTLKLKDDEIDFSCFLRVTQNQKQWLQVRGFNLLISCLKNKEYKITTWRMKKTIFYLFF
jgi:hypothetical protein